MAQKFSWDPSYSVGNALLDQQHQKLLALCADTTACMETDSPAGREHFHAILHELCNYADVHFHAEEELLAQHHYPGLSTQQAEHSEYRAQLAEFLYAATIGTLDKTGLQQYLGTWWQHHILESDMQYRGFWRDGE
jgi:hemerythrin